MILRLQLGFMYKMLIPAMIGNALEWYDYALYAQFSYIIADTFFPNSELKEILTLAIFASGFIVRPFGAIVFGHIGDKFGRKIALSLGIFTMIIPTAAIGLLPSSNSIGIAAPILLTLFRLIQGFSLGGEFSGCIAYVVENSPNKYRGLSGSTAFVSMCIGMLIGSLTADYCRHLFGEEILRAWAWRVPFIIGLGIGIVGIYIRSYLSESKIYEEAKAKGSLSKKPINDILRFNIKQLLIGIGLYLSVTVPFYIITVYMITFVVDLGYSIEFANRVNVFVLISMICALPISGYLSDRIGRKPVLTSALMAMFCGTYYIFSSIYSKDPTMILASSCVLAFILGIYMGPIPTLLVENFPTNIRFTGVSLSYNISAALFGGTAPFAIKTLTNITHIDMFVAFYIMFFILISMLSLFFYHETYLISLNDDKPLEI